MDQQIKRLINQHQLKHIAIIMDGNGRWAKQRGEERPYGHKFGSERVIEITRRADELGVKYLSLYAFSTENWKRPKGEVLSIFDLLSSFINRELNQLVEENVQLRVMGDISQLPLTQRQAVNYAMNKTKKNDGLVLNIGLNYGSRAEIARAFKKIYQDIDKNILTIDQLDDQVIQNYLYTYDMPDPDLLIRTGGEHRLSNFMLFQLAYTELYITDTLWPDFTSKALEEAIMSFFARNRRFGGLNDS